MTSRQRAFVDWVIGQEVQIDSSGNRGVITSVSVTSDGFILGRTEPGYDRGVFLGQVPDDDFCGDFLARNGGRNGNARLVD